MAPPPGINHPGPRTDGEGKFEARFAAPSLPYGSHDICAHASVIVSGQYLEATACASFFLQPVLILGTPSGPPEAHITAAGAGFPPLAEITFVIGYQYPPSAIPQVTAHSDAQGRFTVHNIVWPKDKLVSGAARPGPHRLCAIAEAADVLITACAEFTIVYPAGLHLNPGTGPIGSVLTLTGTGLAPGQPFSLWLDDTVLKNPDQTCALLNGPHDTDAYGAFQSSLVLRSPLIDCQGHSISLTRGRHTICAGTPPQPAQCAALDITEPIPADPRYVALVALVLLVVIGLGAVATITRRRHRRH